MIKKIKTVSVLTQLLFPNINIDEYILLYQGCTRTEISVWFETSAKFNENLKFYIQMNKDWKPSKIANKMFQCVLKQTTASLYTVERDGNDVTIKWYDD